MTATTLTKISTLRAEIERRLATIQPTLDRILSPPRPEPDWIAIADRADWPVNTTRGRWVSY